MEHSPSTKRTRRIRDTRFRYTKQMPPKQVAYKLCNEEDLWQDLLRNKYLKHRTLSQISKKAGDSHFLSSLMGVKDQFLNLGRFKLVSGNQIRFWEDNWLGNQKLKDQFPNLFNIVRRKHATVA